jgi:branched-chain amino acid aminotransferase
MKDVLCELKEPSEPVILPKELGFGQIFTPHVFEMDYKQNVGWCNKRIHPMEKLELHPATMFIHYGQALFEGMKAFHQVNDDIMLFRPDKHFQRLNNSARRLCMPEIDIEPTIDILKELVWIDRGWIPTKKGEALYLRPFMYGCDPVLGVRPANCYKFMMILSPVGAYYPEGFRPVKILIQDDYVRAVRKGLGECKTPANYAASLLGAEIARKSGYTQVLWLDAIELKYIEEVGTMNIYIAFKDEIVTPKLTGGILHGITRLSVLQMLRDMGYQVNERQVSLQEFVDRYDAGEVLDVFGTGTASIISSVGELKFKDKIMKINDGKTGELARLLFDNISGIQHGLLPDKYNWLVRANSEVPVES